MKLTGFGRSASPTDCCDLRDMFREVSGEREGGVPGLLDAGEPAIPDLLNLAANSGKKEVSPTQPYHWRLCMSTDSTSDSKTGMRQLSGVQT